jgi:hypothetical protein
MKIDTSFKETQPPDTNKCGGYALASILSSFEAKVLPPPFGEQIYKRIQGKQNYTTVLDPTDPTKTKTIKDPRIDWMAARISKGTKMNMPSAIASVAKDSGCAVEVFALAGLAGTAPFDKIFGAEDCDVLKYTGKSFTVLNPHNAYNAPAKGVAHVILVYGGVHWVAGDCVETLLPTGGKKTEYHLYNSDPTKPTQQVFADPAKALTDYMDAITNPLKLDYGFIYIELT